MRILLDTHVFIWWMADDERLSRIAYEILADRDSELLWSAASTWELAIKASLGKLHLPEPVDAYVRSRMRSQGLGPLPIYDDHAAAVQGLPWHHRDPFDRLLVAQAKVEGVPLLTGDPWIRQYEVKTIW